MVREVLIVFIIGCLLLSSTGIVEASNSDIVKGKVKIIDVEILPHTIDLDTPFSRSCGTAPPACFHARLSFGAHCPTRVIPSCSQHPRPRLRRVPSKTVENAGKLDSLLSFHPNIRARTCVLPKLQKTVTYEADIGC